MLSRPTHRGFTLVELAIVLVIIGLLVAGVLIGQTLIRTSELRGIVSTIEQTDAAVNAFRGKYNGLPGDLVNATNFWSADTCPYPGDYAAPTTATCNGNGDGKIGAGASSQFSPEHLEYGRFWQQLSNANLVAGTFSGVPAAGSVSYMYLTENGNGVALKKYCGACFLGVMYWDAYQVAATGQIFTSVSSAVLDKHAYSLGQIYGWYDVGINPAFKAPEAYWIDSKMDDGNGRSGRVIASTENTFGATNHCQSGSGVYLSVDTFGPVEQPASTWQATWGCSLFIRSSF